MSDLTRTSTESWHFWQDTAHSPAYNMAADEALLNHATRRGLPLLRFYTWDRPSVSIGYIQRHSAAPAGFAVVRRPTGGGVVYHDHDFTYTLVFPRGHRLTTLDRNQSYDDINRSVQQALLSLRLPASLSEDQISAEVDRQAMVCFSNPTRYDILLGGRKVGGSAQRRNQHGILHQGSLHFGAPLPVSRQTLAAAIKQAFTETMQVVFSDYQPDPELSQQIDTLAQEKYATSAWNQRR